MDNITNILLIWSSGTRSGNRGCVTVENQQVDLSHERGPKQNLGAFPDHVVGDAVIRALRVVTEGRNQDPDRELVDRDRDRDRANPDRVRANPDRSRANRDRDHDHVVRGLGLETVLDRATVENRQVDPPRGEEQDRTLRRSVRTTNRPADQSQVLEHVVLGPDENRDPEVAPVTGIVTEASAAIDRLPSSKSREQDHDLHHRNEDHAVVLGLCQSHQVVEVALGRELPPQIILMSKT